MEFLSMNDVLKKLKVSKSYLNRLRKNDDSFPKAVKLSDKRNTVFNKVDVENWMYTKIYKQLDIFENQDGVLLWICIYIILKKVMFFILI